MAYFEFSLPKNVENEFKTVICEDLYYVVVENDFKRRWLQHVYYHQTHLHVHAYTTVI